MVGSPAIEDLTDTLGWMQSSVSMAMGRWSAGPAYHLEVLLPTRLG